MRHAGADQRFVEESEGEQRAAAEGEERGAPPKDEQRAQAFDALPLNEPAGAADEHAWFNDLGDRFVLRSITDEIMYDLMQLSEQEYVDMYATSMKERLLTRAKRRARELQEAARPGRAVPELEEALGGDEDEANPWSDESRDGL